MIKEYNENKYKLIAVDIDGTLIDGNNNLTEITKRAIRAADYVTLSNDEDGVAYVINKFILEEKRLRN